MWHGRRAKLRQRTLAFRRARDQARLEKAPERFRATGVQKTMSANPSGPSKPQRPSPDKVDEALHDVVEAERDRGDLNPGAEPDQKSEVEKPDDKER
jgi:hypothetical protein